MADGPDVQQPVAKTNLALKEGQQAMVLDKLLLQCRAKGLEKKKKKAFAGQVSDPSIFCGQLDRAQCVSPCHTLVH